MKKIGILLLLAIFVLQTNGLMAQAPAEKITGYYLAVDDEGNPNSQVRVFKASNGKFYGEIVWLKEPLDDNGKEKVDDKNPDPKMHTRKIMNLRILHEFVYDKERDEWSEGTIYSPKTGKTYKSYLKFEPDGRLKVRGYIGSAWMGLGKTVHWTKEKELRK